MAPSPSFLALPHKIEEHHCCPWGNSAWEFFGQPKTNAGSLSPPMPVPEGLGSFGHEFHLRFIIFDNLAWCISTVSAVIVVPSQVVYSQVHCCVPPLECTEDPVSSASISKTFVPYLGILASHRSHFWISMWRCCWQCLHLHPNACCVVLVPLSIRDPVPPGSSWQ